MKGHGLRAAVSLGLCAALLTGCSLRLPQPDSVPSVALDPLTGQEMVWPGQRPAAVDYWQPCMERGRRMLKNVWEKTDCVKCFNDW